MQTRICYCGKVICECDCPVSLSLDALGAANQCPVMAEVNLLAKERFFAPFKVADVFIHTDNYPFERSVNICGKQYREYIKERLKVFADACHKKHGITK